MRLSRRLCGAWTLRASRSLATAACDHSWVSGIRVLVLNLDYRETSRTPCRRCTFEPGVRARGPSSAHWVYLPCAGPIGVTTVSRGMTLVQEPAKADVLEFSGRAAWPNAVPWLKAPLLAQGGPGPSPRRYQTNRSHRAALHSCAFDHPGRVLSSERQQVEVPSELELELEIVKPHHPSDSASIVHGTPTLGLHQPNRALRDCAVAAPALQV